jgi:hypothetical protein
MTLQGKNQGKTLEVLHRFQSSQKIVQMQHRFTYTAIACDVGHAWLQYFVQYEEQTQSQRQSFSAI